MTDLTLWPRLRAVGGPLALAAAACSAAPASAAMLTFDNAYFTDSADGKCSGSECTVKFDFANAADRLITNVSCQFISSNSPTILEAAVQSNYPQGYRSYLDELGYPIQDQFGYYARTFGQAVAHIVGHGSNPIVHFVLNQPLENPQVSCSIAGKLG